MRRMKLLKKLGKKRAKSCQITGTSATFSDVIFFFSILAVLHSSVVNPAWADSLFKPDGTCTRSFIYRNRTYPVDSSRKLDGEGMRFVLKKTSQSEEMLNDYQSRLKTSFIPAYVGSLGLATAIGGSIYAGTISNQLGNRDTRNGFLFGGLFLAIAGYGYGQFALKQKEKTLEKAVETYNDAVPEPERVRIDLMPLPTGSGGEIKTQVPF